MGCACAAARKHGSQGAQGNPEKTFFLKSAGWLLISVCRVTDDDLENCVRVVSTLRLWHIHSQFDITGTAEPVYDPRQKVIVTSRFRQEQVLQRFSSSRLCNRVSQTRWLTMLRFIKLENESSNFWNIVIEQECQAHCRRICRTYQPKKSEFQVHRHTVQGQLSAIPGIELTAQSLSE